MITCSEVINCTGSINKNWKKIAFKWKNIYVYIMVGKGMIKYILYSKGRTILNFYFEWQFHNIKRNYKKYYTLQIVISFLVVCSKKQKNLHKHYYSLHNIINYDKGEDNLLLY